MAYDVSEERLKVRGSEQITRDLLVGRDLYITGTANINNNDVLTSADVVDTVADGNMNAVTSNAVYDYIDAAITQVLNTGF